MYSVPEPPLVFPLRCSSGKKSRVPAGKNRTGNSLAVGRQANHLPTRGLTQKPKKTRNLICDMIWIRHTKKTRIQICALCCSSDCSFFLISPTIFDPLILFSSVYYFYPFFLGLYLFPLILQHFFELLQIFLLLWFLLKACSINMQHSH